jgi:hypothetical protein
MWGVVGVSKGIEVVVSMGKVMSRGPSCPHCAMDAAWLGIGKDGSGLDIHLFA